MFACVGNDCSWQIIPLLFRWWSFCLFRWSSFCFGGGHFLGGGHFFLGGGHLFVQVVVIAVKPHLYTEVLHKLAGEGRR